jgi:hypothetical protein
MGLSQSAVLDMDRMSELVAEVLGLFAKSFPDAFRECTVGSVKEEAMLLCRKGWELSSAPVPAHYLKRGYLTKQGHSVKSWKRRLFTALNAADNFVVVYFVDEHTAVERGRIECFGCRVEAFSSEESASFGPYGFKIVPYVDTNRSWLICADSEEEKAEWMAVFSNACRKVAPTVHADPVMAQAFLVTLERTRKAYSLYGRAEAIGTEVESLSTFVIQILLREMLDDAFSAIKSSAQRASSIRSVRGVVEGIVRDAAVMTWAKCVEDASRDQAGLRAAVGNHMSVLLDTEERMKGALREETACIIRPVMNDVLSDVVLPFISVVFQHAISAHSAAVAGFWEALRTWITRSTSSLDAAEWDWAPMEKPPAAAHAEGGAGAGASSHQSSGVKFDAREDIAWSRQYHKYGEKIKTNLGKAKGSPSSSSPGCGNTAYNRNKSFTAADAQPLGRPLRKATSMCYDPEGDSQPFSPSGKGQRSYSVTDEPSRVRLQKRITNELFKCHVGVDDMAEGPLHNCASILWNLYTTDLASIHDGALSETLSAYDVYTYWLDALQALLHNAIYTFELSANSLSEEGLTPGMMLDLVNDVTSKLLIDAQKSLVDGLIFLSHDLIRCTCQEMIEGPCLDLGPNFAAKIPVKTRDFLHIDSLIEVSVTSQIGDVLSRTVNSFVAQQKKKLVSPFK